MGETIPHGAGGDDDLVCTTCGTTPPTTDQASARLTWARGTEAGRVVWTCERCQREHLRSIEGKLDSQWW